MYPLCLDISGKLCIVIGGGSVAQRKVNGLLAAGAQVRVVSPQVTPVLSQLAADGHVQWCAREYTAGDLAGGMLIFAATDNRAVQEAIAEEAGAAGQLLNVIDDPSSCGFQVPAVVRQGDLTMAVSTSGKSPAVAALVRHHLEQEFGAEYGILLELMSCLRDHELEEDRDLEERKILFQKILHDDIVLWIATGQWDMLRAHLRSVLGYDVDFAVSQLEKDS